MPNASTILLAVVPLVATTGCALHYFDPETGTEHIWGIGHMAMTPGTPSEGVRAIGRRTDTVGFSVGKLQEGVYLELGWGARQRVDIVDANTQLCLAWPRGSFYNVRVGTEFPTGLNDCGRGTRRDDR
jgi:hypothetical protein